MRFWHALEETHHAFVRSHQHGRRPVSRPPMLWPRPVLLLHGSADDVVPAWHSEMIYFNAHGPRTLWVAPGGHHNQLYDSHREGVQRRVEEVVRVAVARKNEAEVA